MKNSTYILIIILASTIIHFLIHRSSPENMVFRIEITIVTVGYFIVKQLEKNKN